MKYTLAEIPALEQAFLETGDSSTNYGWSPLPISIFIRLIDMAAGEAPPRAFFLEAGSGIGTKLFIARERHGMWEYGIESNEYMITFASTELEVRCYHGDVMNVAYEMADIVYISRPFKNDEAEIEYEKMVHRQMRPGTILMAAWAAVKPQWPIIYREGQHGVWQKSQPGAITKRSVPAFRPNTVGEYRKMISRESGTDPLVSEPGPRHG